METKKMKVVDLKPHPMNEEIYGFNEDISDLVEKIKRSNTVHTLVINSSNYILAGHRRRRACMLLGIKEVDVEIRDFDTEEEELEFIIDNNATREKTAAQKSKEAKALKEVESMLALKRKSVGGKGGFKDTPNSAGLQSKGESRDLVAKKVGFKSGHEVDRAIRTVNIIDELTEKGRTEDANLIRGVLNNRSVSAAEELAKNIDIVEISEDDKVLIKSGKKSPHSLVEAAKKKQKLELEINSQEEIKEDSTQKDADEADYDKHLKYSRGCDIDKDQFALEQAQRLQVEVASFSAKLNYFGDQTDVCRNMPLEYKELIMEQSGELMEKLSIILEYLKQEGDQEEPA